MQRAAIQKYEKGTVTNIPINTIEKIANVFDVSPTYIVGWSTEPSNPLAAEVRVIQGVKKFFGMEAVELLEVYMMMNRTGKRRLFQYARDMVRLYED